MVLPNKQGTMTNNEKAIELCDERAKLIVELSERGYWLDKIQEQIDIKKEIEKL